MKKLKIALIAPFEEAVPPLKYGGTELVIYNLAETLIKFGHEVHLLATGDSKSKAHLIPIFPRAIRKEKISQDLNIRNALKFIGLERVIDNLLKLKVDLIHNHLGWRLIPFAKYFKTPMVTTLHGPLDSFYQKLIYGLFPNHPYISISNSQRKPFKKLNYVATVYNGIEIEKFDFNPLPGKYLAFLGRISPEKNPKLAIQIAKKLKKELRIAAKIDAVDREYYEKEIKPLIDGRQIKFLGEIGAKEKNKFLKNAYVLLAPINWQEPFGLFMIEAMACGTPVIVSNLGSAKEVVEDKKTGFVVQNNLGAFLSAFQKIKFIKREDCRKRVERYFTREKMTENYLKVYEKIISQKEA